jgi:hypothetical protein
VKLRSPTGSKAAADEGGAGAHRRRARREEWGLGGHNKESGAWVKGTPRTETVAKLAKPLGLTFAEVWELQRRG